MLSALLPLPRSSVFRHISTTNRAEESRKKLFLERTPFLSHGEKRERRDARRLSAEPAHTLPRDSAAISSRTASQRRAVIEHPVTADIKTVRDLNDANGKRIARSDH